MGDFMSDLRNIEVRFSQNKRQASYNISVGRNALEHFGDTVLQLKPNVRIALISDETIGPTYGSIVKKRLTTAGFEAADFLIPAGEKSKNIDYAMQLWQALTQFGMTRSDVVVALGGGVVGDLAGFVAATYMRGIDFIQVPTTLLAMVDASVGGKTAIDIEQGKNLVGAFHQPIYVCADTRVLKSLSDEDWANGFAEIAKSSVICKQRSFYEWLRSNADGLYEHENDLLEEAIVRSVEFKASVVSKDEKEQGLRECLNYGHTLGHAIETCAGFGTIGHGRAVAEGMRFAARLAVEVLGAEIEFVQKQDSLLDSLGLQELAWTSTPERLLHVMKSDKKVRNNKVRFVLAKDFSSWETVEVPDETLMQHLEAWCIAKRRLCES